MTTNTFDLIIIGAGPAGMAASATANEKGLSVALIDEQGSPGGQIYRGIKHSVLADKKVLGADYYYGQTLLYRLPIDEQKSSNFSYYPQSMVWSIEPNLTINFSSQGSSTCLKAKKILIATGAIERASPFPGWTLPGVMTCGSAQILLKTSGLTPPTPLVLAGSGPLLLLIAVQLHRAGIAIDAVLDTTPADNFHKALKHFPAALQNLPLLLKGANLLLTLKRAGIRYIKHTNKIRAIEGQDFRVGSVRFQSPKGEEELACRSLLIHQGVVPNVQLSRSLNLLHNWDPLQLCWRPHRNNWNETSMPGVFIAGDGGGIGGAKAAELQGKLSALYISSKLQFITKSQRQKESQPIRKSLHRHLAIRPFLDQLYQPAKEFLTPIDETIVCRCEEVTAGELRKISQNGCSGPNQAKAFSRSGMGPCQGRLCGLTVAHIISDTRNEAMEDVGYYQIRTPIKPLTIGELADLSN